MEHLSSADASFLHLETPETPMHVGSLMLLELPEGYTGDFFEDVKEMIGDRMHLADVLIRKLATMPFELGEPVWIEDNDIDLDYHIRHLTLRKPGTLKQLDQMIGRLHSMLLDRSRPLWEIYVIDGLENGQIGFYTKVHHSGIDGKAGAELAKVLYDTTPEIRKVAPARHRSGGGGSYQLGMAELLQASLINSARQYQKLAELVPTAAKAFGAAANILVNQRTAPGKRALELGLAPTTIFNESITNQRSYSTFSVPMGEIKATGKRVGGTINTVVMSMCSAAVRSFLKERGLLPKESLIAMVPASLRAPDDDSMNNQVTMIRVDLATEIEDLSERFKAIHASSEAGKAMVRELRPVLNVDVPVMGSPWLMTGVASLIGRSKLINQLPSMGNVLVSNVPGPPAYLYVAGAKMLHYYPVSIPYHGNALNITVHSYVGQLEFGLTACRRVLSQEESYELCDRMLEALREIEALPPLGEEPAESTSDGAPKEVDRPAAKQATGGKRSTRGTATKKKPADQKAQSPQ